MHIKSFEIEPNHWITILSFGLLPLERNCLFDEYYTEMNFTSFENSEVLLN